LPCSLHLADLSPRAKLSLIKHLSRVSNMTYPKKCLVKKCAATPISGGKPSSHYYPDVSQTVVRMTCDALRLPPTNAAIEWSFKTVLKYPPQELGSSAEKYAAVGML
ncbi:unnamed protein product, partial [Discosporangium mesarthrocarpum]